MTSGRRVELEIEALEAEKASVDADVSYKAYQNNSGMPCEPGMDDSSVVELAMRELDLKRSRLNAEIAKKRLELFDLQGL